MKNEQTTEPIVIKLSGRIDSVNAGKTEEDILSQLSGVGGRSLTLDMEKLEYISSAGLRVILRLKKTYPDIRIVNVGSDVYEILEMTGFTEMMPVEKAYRVVSVEGCEEIGRGA
ncbi:MAG: STAS domain-containing protein, partial [Clostridiales bacterium]|nr:STAS domain-containing protein [Clostridiales bacterium]